ncbi:MAG: cytochrome P450, partial [Gammaproteobacteria bacterium]|nr:cytochrome P450 [Gammaproteobacteria bacterium]
MTIDPYSLETLDVSQPHRFAEDSWRPAFARLREHAPVHYCPDSANGPYWSVTSHSLIKEVDTNHQVFSSERGGIAIVDPYTTQDG